MGLWSTALYEHMTPAAPAATARSNGARYVCGVRGCSAEQLLGQTSKTAQSLYTGSCRASSSRGSFSGPGTARRVRIFTLRGLGAPRRVVAHTAFTSNGRAKPRCLCAHEAKSAPRLSHQVFKCFSFTYLVVVLLGPYSLGPGRPHQPGSVSASSQSEPPTGPRRGLSESTSPSPPLRVHVSESASLPVQVEAVPGRQMKALLVTDNRPPSTDSSINFCFSGSYITVGTVHGTRDQTSNSRSESETAAVYLPSPVHRDPRL